MAHSKSVFFYSTYDLEFLLDKVLSLWHSAEECFEDEYPGEKPNYLKLTIEKLSDGKVIDSIDGKFLGGNDLVETLNACLDPLHTTKEDFLEEWPNNEPNEFRISVDFTTPHGT